MFKIKIASAFVQGRGHIKNNTPCQDRTYSIIDEKNNFSFLALADGAGSCKLSHIGAEIVTKKVAELFHENYDKLLLLESENVKKYIISNLIIKLDEYAKKEKINIKDLSSTLLFVAIKNDSYISGHLGDGVIGYLTNNDEIEVLSYPENGEFSNATYFVPSNDSHNFLKLFRGKLDKVNGFVLMSDGSEESLYDKKNKQLAPVNSQMINWLSDNSSEKVQEALKNNLEKVIKMKTFDDCSIGILKIVMNKISYILNAELPIQKERLKSENTKYVRNDIKIINAIFNLNCKTIKEIGLETKIRPKTLKRHIKKLQELKIIDFEIK